MNKKALFIIPMLSPVFMTTAKAGLPDEINYSPYQRTYEQSAQQVDILTASLNQAQSELQTAYNRESELTTIIERLELDIARTNSQIQNHIDERQRLMILAEDLDREMKRIEQRLSRAEGERAQAERDVQREQRALKPFHDQLDRLQRELGEANRKVTDANDQLKRLQRVKDAAEGELRSARQAVTNLESTLATQETTLANITTSISNAETRITTLDNNVQTKRAELTVEQQKLAAIDAEIATLRSQIQGNPRLPQNREILEKIRAKSVERNAQNGIVDRKQKEVEGTVNALNQAKTALATLQRQQTALPGAIEQTKRQIEQAKASRAAKKTAFDTALANYDVQNAMVMTLVADANAKSSAVNAQKEEIIRRSGPLNRAMSDLGMANDRVREIGERLRNHSNQYNASVEKINILDQEIPKLRRLAHDMNRDVRGASGELITVQDQIIVLSGDVTRLNSDVRSATVNRDLKYQEYISRYEYYMEKLNEAKTLGASQTDIAMSIARTDSNNAVDARANDLGRQMGNEVAAAEANYWSAIRAEIKGYNDGYNEGYASDSDQMRGEEEGTRAGIAAAQAHAQNVLKPRYFNDFYLKALKTGEVKVIDMVKMAQASFNKVETENFHKNILDILSDISPVTESEVRQSMDIRTDLDTSISTFKTNLSQVYSQEDSYANAANTYEAPTSVPYQRVNCENVYKGITEFKSACASEYNAVFSSKYLAEHFDNYSAQYENLYRSKVSDTRSAVIEGIYESGMTRFYPIAKASGVNDGKDQIYKETFALAKDRAYNNEIPKADAVAKAEASNEVKTWVSNNAAVTITKAEIMASELRGGSAAKIAMDVKNISPRSLSKPVEIVITSAENADLASRKFYIQKADANTTTAFDGIDFNVASTARSGARIKIAGIVKLPGGKYENTIEQPFSVESVTQVNPTLTYSGLNYDRTPSIKGLFRYNTHFLRSNISASVEDIKDGYTVLLTPMAGYESLIKMNNTSVNTGKLSEGKDTEVKFSYSFPKSAKDQEVKLELKYIFNGKVMKSEIIELRPH